MTNKKCFVVYQFFLFNINNYRICIISIFSNIYIDRVYISLIFEYYLTV